MKSEIIEVLQTKVQSKTSVMKRYKEFKLLTTVITVITHQALDAQECG